MNISNPDLYIILVNWNKPNLTLDCIKSINESSYKEYKTVVVDNYSSDNSIEIFKQSNLNFHLIKATENLGYTGGNNLGIEYAMAMNCKYVLLLNNDTLINPNTLFNLVAPLNKDVSIGITQPKIFFYPDSSLIWSGSTKLNKLLLRTRLVGYKEKNDPTLDKEQYLDYAVGCATLIRSSVIEKIGMLDDDYFAVCEDVDYGLRASAAGFKIWYVPDAYVYHIESASAGGADNPQYVYYQARSYLILFSKWSVNYMHFALVFSVYSLSTLIRIAKLLFVGNNRGVAAIYLGFRDFFLKKFGRREYSILKKRG